MSDGPAGTPTTVTIRLEVSGAYAEISGPAGWRSMPGDDREMAAEAVVEMCREAIYGVFKVGQQEEDG